MAKPPDKRETLLAFLERGVAMLHLDARRPGVVIPPQHADDPHLLLNFSYRYAIPDLTIDARGVVATLSFRSRPFRCTIPWSAVYGITSQADGRDEAWPEDLPAEVIDQVQQLDGGDEGAPGKAPSRRVARKPKLKTRTPALRAIDDARPGEGQGPTVEAPAAEDKPAAEPTPEPRPIARGHLRLVK